MQIVDFLADYDDGAKSRLAALTAAITPTSPLRDSALSPKPVTAPRDTQPTGRPLSSNATVVGLDTRTESTFSQLALAATAAAAPGTALLASPSQPEPAAPSLQLPWLHPREQLKASLPADLVLDLARTHVSGADMDAVCVALAENETAAAQAARLLSERSLVEAARGAAVLGRALPAATVHLNLSGVVLQRDVITALAVGLQTLRCVRHLILHTCALSDAAAVGLASALRAAAQSAAASGVASGVQTLDVSNNQLGARAAHAFGTLLATPGCTLTKFSIDCNKLTEPGCGALVSALAHNSTLRTLCIRRCDIGRRAGAALLAAVSGNHVLLHAHVDYNLLASSVIAQLETLLTRNRVEYLQMLLGPALPVLDPPPAAASAATGATGVYAPSPPVAAKRHLKTARSSTEMRGFATPSPSPGRSHSTSRSTSRAGSGTLSPAAPRVAGTVGSAAVQLKPPTAAAAEEAIANSPRIMEWDYAAPTGAAAAATRGILRVMSASPQLMHRPVSPPPARASEAPSVRPASFVLMQGIGQGSMRPAAAEVPAQGKNSRHATQPRSGVDIDTGRQSHAERGYSAGANVIHDLGADIVDAGEGGGIVPSREATDAFDVYLATAEGDGHGEQLVHTSRNGGQGTGAAPWASGPPRGGEAGDGATAVGDDRASARHMNTSTILTSPQPVRPPFSAPSPRSPRALHSQPVPSSGGPNFADTDLLPLRDSPLTLPMEIAPRLVSPRSQAHVPPAALSPTEEAALHSARIVAVELMAPSNSQGVDGSLPSPASSLDRPRPAAPVSPARGVAGDAGLIAGKHHKQRPGTTPSPTRAAIPSARVGPSPAVLARGLFSSPSSPPGSPQWSGQLHQAHPSRSASPASPAPRSPLPMQHAAKQHTTAPLAEPQQAPRPHHLAATASSAAKAVHPPDVGFELGVDADGGLVVVQHPSVASRERVHSPASTAAARSPSPQRAERLPMKRNKPASPRAVSAPPVKLEAAVAAATGGADYMVRPVEGGPSVLAAAVWLASLRSESRGADGNPAAQPVTGADGLHVAGQPRVRTGAASPLPPGFARLQPPTPRSSAGNGSADAAAAHDAAVSQSPRSGSGSGSARSASAPLSPHATRRVHPDHASAAVAPLRVSSLVLSLQRTGSIEPHVLSTLSIPDAVSLSAWSVESPHATAVRATLQAAMSATRSHSAKPISVHSAHEEAPPDHLPSAYALPRVVSQHGESDDHRHVSPQEGHLVPLSPPAQPRVPRAAEIKRNARSSSSTCPSGDAALLVSTSLWRGGDSSDASAVSASSAVPTLAVPLLDRSADASSTLLPGQRGAAKIE